MRIIFHTTGCLIHSRNKGGVRNDRVRFLYMLLMKRCLSVGNAI